MVGCIPPKLIEFPALQIGKFSKDITVAFEHHVEHHQHKEHKTHHFMEYKL